MLTHTETPVSSYAPQSQTIRPPAGWAVPSSPLTLVMLTFLLVPLLAAHSSAQYAGCPETYGVQVYPHEQYCDKFYKCVNGKALKLSAL